MITGSQHLIVVSADAVFVERCAVGSCDSVNNVMREFGPPCRLMWERRGARSLISRHRQPLYRTILCAAKTGCHTIKYRPPAPRSQASISLLNTDSVLTMWSTPRIIMSKYHEPSALRPIRAERELHVLFNVSAFFNKHRLGSFSINGTEKSRVPVEVDECLQTMVAISNHTPVQQLGFFETKHPLHKICCVQGNAIAFRVIGIFDVKDNFRSYKAFVIIVKSWLLVLYLLMCYAQCLAYNKAVTPLPNDSLPISYELLNYIIRVHG